MKKIFSGLVLLVLLAIVLSPFRYAGLPYTHDGENHAARLMNYFLALRQGQFPPRWAPTFAGGYGYPVFNFNYPLANILAIPLIAVKIPVETTLKILFGLGVSLGVVGWYYGLRKVTQKESLSLLAAAAWAVFPYTLSNLYIRGSIGEVLAYGLLPWALIMIWDSFKTASAKNLCCLWIVVAAFLLAHNTLVLMLAVPIAIWIVWNSVRASRLSRIKVLIALACSAGSTLFFWLPALLEKKFIVLDQANVTEAFTQHFISVTQLLWSGNLWWRGNIFGYSFPGPVDTLPLGIGAIGLFALLVAILVMVQGRLTQRMQFLVKLFAVWCGVAWLCTSFSTFFWERVPFISAYLQFPWRFEGFLAVLSMFLFVWSLQNLSKKWFWLGVAVVMYQLWNVAHWQPIHQQAQPDIYYRTWAQTSTIQNENRPQSFTLSEGTRNDQKPNIVPANAGEVDSVSLWNGSKHKYSVNLAQPAQIIEPTMYFPGWETRVQGEKVESQHISADGQISFSLPAGKYEVTTSFTQNTIPRRVGNIASIASIAAFFVLLSYWKVKEKDHEI